MTFSQFVSLWDSTDLSEKNKVMSLFNKLFKTSEASGPKNEAIWLPLTELQQLDQIINESFNKPQLLFKHSTRCGISRMVKNQFETDYAWDSNEADLYYLDLLNYRTISNEIATRFNVYHESPQLIILKNGVVEAHASHGAINDSTLS